MAVKDSELHIYNINTWIRTHRYIHIDTYTYVVLCGGFYMFSPILVDNPEW